MYDDEIKSPHKQKLAAAAAAVLAFATMLCVVLFTLILNTLDNSSRGRSAPHPPPLIQLSWSF